MTLNLLLPRKTIDRHRELFDSLSGLRLLAMQDDGTVSLDGNPVSLGDYPVHLTCLNHDLMEGNLMMPWVEIVQQADELVWMQTITAGLDHPMFRAVLERGVRLCNSDAQAPAIAEYVVGAALYRFQGFTERAAAQSEREWRTVPFRQIHGSEWLIVGFGNIGRRVGRIVRGFDGRVTGVKRRVSSSTAADEIITFDALPQHVPSADVIVISCALTDETRNLVDSAFLAKVKPGALLVNIARGDIIDEPALLDALDSGGLDYAVLDVFREEPLPENSPFWQHARVHVTPHASNAGNATRPRAEELFLENLQAFLENRPLRNEVGLDFFAT